MLLALEFRPEYGLIGGGPVNASLVGKLPGRSRALGPVAASSLRVASRIANKLRAGTPVRTPDELNRVRVILAYAPCDQLPSVIDLLARANIEWRGKSLIYFGCAAERAEIFRAAGASVASVRECPVPGRVMVEGESPALARAKALARQMKMRPIEIKAGSEEQFGAALMLGSAAITPLIDHAADLLRACGLRDSDAVEMASGAVGQTAREYAHSGKQSWEWHIRKPDADQLRACIEATSGAVKDILARLVLLGMESFGKHPEAAEVARETIEGVRET